MLIVNYKGYTLGVTEKDNDDDVTIFAFKNIDGEYFIKQTVYSESIDEQDVVEELCEYVDELLNNTNNRVGIIIDKTIKNQSEEELEELDEV